MENKSPEIIYQVDHEVSKGANILIAEKVFKYHIGLYEKEFKKNGDWKTPLALLVSIIITLCTAQFKDFVFEPNEWRWIFFIGLISSVLWLSVSLYKTLHNKPSVENLLEELKNS